MQLRPIQPAAKHLFSGETLGWRWERARNTIRPRWLTIRPQLTWNQPRRTTRSCLKRQKLEICGKNGMKAYNKGCGLLEEDAAAAVEQFTAAIELDPTRDAAYLQRAVAYEQLGRTTAALEDYQAAAEKRPTSAAYLGVADLSLYSAAWDDAIEALETGIQTVDPEERTVLENRLAAMENAEIYNRAGEVCVTQSFYETGQLEERTFINPLKNSKVTFAYDGDGKQIKHIVQGYDEFGHEISFTSYDAQGSILEYYDRAYSRDGSLLCEYREFDEEGRLRKSEDYWI